MKLSTRVPVSDVAAGSARKRNLFKVSRLSRKMRVGLGILTVFVLLLLVASGYLIFRPRVQPLSLPTLPAHLSMADLGLADWEQYQQPFSNDPLHNPLLPESPQISSSLALLEDAAGQALIHEGKLEQGLGYLAAAAQADPDNLRYANDYRIALRDHGRYQDEENFFSHILQQHSTVNVQLNLALSYVDEMRSCPKPPDGLVCQAQYSSRSISVLGDVLQKQPYNIVARYARGLNHLYWPTLMGHLPKAQVDLQFAVALLKPLDTIPNAFAPEAYAALGDVFAKDSHTDDARNVWLTGKNVVASPSILDQRLGIAGDRLVDDENNSLRGLGVYVDTNITLFWQKGR